MANLTNQELYPKAEQLQELLGATTLLDALLQAMDSNELQANLEYIDRMYDTCLF